MRLDQALVQRKLVESRSKAQSLIQDGYVYVNQVVTRKASLQVTEDQSVEVHGPRQWVARSALKLLAALDHWKISVERRVCLDIGSSTGGFTEVLLDRGAGRIIAIDVGTEQMVPSLRCDPRVELHEQTHINEASTMLEPASVDIMVCDVSFISLLQVVPLVLPLLSPTGQGVWLLKPQFEVGREYIAKHGVVRDAKRKQRLVEEFKVFFQAQGFAIVETLPSPLLGGSGNEEFLIYTSYGKAKG